MVPTNYYLWNIFFKNFYGVVRVFARGLNVVEFSRYQTVFFLLKGNFLPLIKVLVGQWPFGFPIWGQGYFFFNPGFWGFPGGHNPILSGEEFFSLF